MQTDVEQKKTFKLGVSNSRNPSNSQVKDFFPVSIFWYLQRNQWQHNTSSGENNIFYDPFR